MAKPLIEDLPNWLPLDAWNGWLEVRRARKIPNTERALRIALRKLDRLRAAGQDVEAVIDQSTERGWTTFWPYRDTVASVGSESRPLQVQVKGEESGPRTPIPDDVRERMAKLIRGTRH